ncbi:MULTISPECIES: type II toxin-antitoxin system VapC family toxin [unclassified Microcystis]|jgi:predicted nucleic acid-binding protein|uniref:Type II toxin-antitoxin system VapC family toxin n=2 Tax=Microcystis TaxID=1125 RepID=A0A552KHU4_9CHRO|nr:MULTISPECIES: type II toxin-antitoxin system VapC family toxin [unclassified Microcystis]MCA2816040.1 type II toxin-antitoxin system VapC family toxin [Microcystis sp. M085S1]MCA2856880.1 type II toxin-antitoxin system VapC family toxin [Microcystis sp. M065S1]TRT78834.1 MAG: type II toxin-antitoxin system VapC family toxin [Microcystis flos-aquae Ma_QC_C_20070823_S18]TRU03295.1 MAG: type II toxin-antitoxin system VapC family toxin [Microcystis flos-aquae Ma_QC_C_20070823_S18D]TRV07556.1 MA
MTFLCDTNMISELARPQPNAGVLQWSREVSSIALSVITLEEIYYGLTSKPNARINTWFQQFFNYYCQIIPITSEIALYAGEIRGKLRTQGKTRSQADMLIAATAKIHKLTLVTRNIRDFEGCEILLFNPFS